LLTHANIFANCHPDGDVDQPGVRPQPLRALPVVIPYFHIYAFTVCMMMGIRVGALQIILPKYDPEQVLDAIRTFRPTYFPARPDDLRVAAQSPEARRVEARVRAPLQQRRRAVPGGGPRGVGAAHRAPASTRATVLSETSPVTHSTPQLAFRKLGTIGFPVPDTDVKIVDVDTGRRELPVGEAGELCICGPQVMKGYWNRPDESGRVLRADADGRIWFHTGDNRTHGRRRLHRDRAAQEGPDHRRRLQRVSV
jgi:long-chain acyl-CoA synthetase